MNRWAFGAKYAVFESIDRNWQRRAFALLDHFELHLLGDVVIKPYLIDLPNNRFVARSLTPEEADGSHRIPCSWVHQDSMNGVAGMGLSLIDIARMRKY